MSSNFNNGLRLEMIGTGDQAGVWGSTTNTNLGVLLVDAISGYTSVSILASPQALTANDGAEDESRNAVIALVNVTTGADFSVAIPPSEKTYVIKNTSAYVATIYNATAKNGTTSAGGTTIAIPAGKTMTVWSDGTNVAQQADNFISPALTGTPTVPTATFGTNTTQAASTAFVQAALQALHPIGSIYTSTSSTNPGTAFGFGTWVAYGAGRVLIGNGGGYTAGSTGGSADAIVVAHSHTASSSSSFTGFIATTTTESADHTHNVSATTGTESATHSHAITVNSGGAHTHTYKTYGLGNSGLTGNANTNSDWGWATTGNPAGTSEGSHSHTASSNTESALHSHSFSTSSSGVSTLHSHNFTPSGSVSTSTTVASAGSSGTGANLQPYVVVYMWNRTA